jgi:hypothetical protein
VHAHPPTATGYAVAGKSMDEYSMIETVIAIGSIPLTPYGTPSTDEVPEAITPYLPNHDVMLLQNHGALTVGCDLITAYYRMETLELYAKISLTAHLLGGAREIEKPQIDKLMDLRENYYKVSGRHPGYKKYNDLLLSGHRYGRFRRPPYPGPLGKRPAGDRRGVPLRKRHETPKRPADLGCGRNFRPHSGRSAPVQRTG